MKTTTKFFLAIFVSILSFSNLYSQQANRYDLSMVVDFNGAKTVLKVSNVSYNLNTYVVETDPATPTKPEPLYISVTSLEVLPKDFYKIFESYKNKVNGYIEVKDNFGKNPTKKIEFKNSSIVLSESMSNYTDGYSSNITIYGNFVTIDGVGILSK
jgi:hypothetical protein